MKIEKRAHERALQRGNHANRHLQRVWLKHGAHNFKIGILSLVEPSECLQAEQAWIDGFQPFYNICKSVTAPMLGRTFGPETREKMRIVSTGRKHTEESKAKMRAIAKQRVPKPASAETRKKMSASKMGHQVSAATRLAIGRAQLGPLNHRFGKKVDPQVMALRSAKMRGHVVTEETRRKISATSTGRIRTPEQRARIRAGIIASYARRAA